MRYTRLVFLFLATCLTSFTPYHAMPQATGPKKFNPPGPAWLDLAYATQSPNQKLDLYLPAHAKQPVPVVLWVHGGGWCTGSRKDGISGKMRLVNHGIAVASVGYRFSKEAKFPSQIYDLKAAVRYLRAHATALNIDPNRIGVWGSSAGGNMAALLGTSGGVTALEDLSMGNAAYSSRVNAVVDWYGPIDFLKLDQEMDALHFAPYMGLRRSDAKSTQSRLIGAPIETRPDLVAQANPATYASLDDPAIWIQHGTDDNVVPFTQSMSFYQVLQNRLGKEKVQLTLFPASHGDVANWPKKYFNTRENLEAIAVFFERILKKY